MYLKVIVEIICRPTNQSINQSISQSINQSISQLVNQIHLTEFSRLFEPQTSPATYNNRTDCAQLLKNSVLVTGSFRRVHFISLAFHYRVRRFS